MIYKEKFRIGLGDLGTNGKVTNKAILKMFEDTAGFHSDSVNNGVARIDKNGTAWIIMGWKIEVLDRPGNGERMTVETWSRNMQRAHAFRDFRLLDENGNIRALGSSVWAMLDVKSRRLVRIASGMDDLYESDATAVFSPWKLEKANAPETFEKIGSYCIRRCDTDIIGHMHNLNYLDIATEILPDEVYESGDFDNLIVTYRNEVKQGEDVTSGYYKDGDKHSVIIIGGKDTAAIIKMW